MSIRIKTLRSIAALALLLPLLAACGGTTPTPAPAPTSTTAVLAPAASPTTAMMAASPTTAMVMTPTTAMVMTPTAGMVMTPTAAMTGTSAVTPTAVPPTPIASSFQGSAGAFRWRVGEDVAQMDPALMEDGVSINVAQNIYDGLTQFNPQTLAVEPAIATKWDINTDGSVYTFHLRNDVKFSDGTVVTAKDFVYSWNRLLANPKAPYSFVFADIKGADEVVASAASTDTTKTKLTAAEGIKAVDDSTLQVTLKGPSAYFLSQTALWSYWIVNQKVVGSDPLSSDWAQKADTQKGAGTGAYTIKEWARNDHMVLTANDSYWGNVKPSVKEIDEVVIQDGSTSQLRYESGQLDSSELYTADYDRISKDPKLSKELHAAPQARTVWLGMNQLTGQFAVSGGDKAKNLRIAIAKAVDRADLIDKALNGVGAPAYTLLPKGVPGYQDFKAYEMDLPGAKQALSDAGYPNGQGLKLTYTTRDREDQRAVATVIQAQLKQNLNIDVSVVPVAWSTFLDERRNHKYEFFYGSWGQDYPDPQDWLFPLAVSGQHENNEGYANPAFDKLVIDANKLADPTKQTDRYKMYNQAEQIYLKDAPIVPLYQFQTDYMLKPGWSGWGYNAQFVAPFRYLSKSGS